MKKICYTILWSTIEDFVGLWDILWELNTALPKNDQKENQENAKNILKYFLEHNFVIFYMSKWGSDELEELDIVDALNLLENEKYWQPPALNDLCIKVGNTEKGEKFYNEKLAKQNFLCSGY